MRARIIKGSPERSASAAWAEIDRMVADTLAPAAAIDVDDVRDALDALEAVGPMLVAGGVLVDNPVVLRALPLQLEINVALGNAVLSGDEHLGKVPGAATATEWAVYVPEPEPWSAQVRAAAAAHAHLRAGIAPAEPEGAAVTAAAAIDIDVLRRVTGGTR